MAIRKMMSTRQTEPKKKSNGSQPASKIKNPPNYVESKKRNSTGSQKPSYNPVRSVANRLSKAAPSSSRQDARSTIQRSISAIDEGILSGVNKLKRELGIASPRQKKTDIKQSAKNAAMQGGYYKKGKK